jgi:two-component system, sensor histidine kinase and response regulator
MHIETIDCRGLLDELAVGLRPLADEKGLTLELLSLSEPIELLSDRHAVSQIVINLATNAIKFTDEGSVRLEVGQCLDGDQPVTRFAVTDTGCGISLEDHQHVLAAFDEIGTANAGPLLGSGLGLYISHSLAELIGGEITFESILGGGSTFALEVTGRGSA